MNCQYCDGYWMQTENGLGRCTFCVKGRSLAAADEARKNPPTICPALTLSEEHATVVVGMMATIKMFPSDATVRSVIAREIRKLCPCLADAVWLADRMISLYDNWPGVRELRRVVCQSRIPHDGVMALGCSEVYPDGIPSERPQSRPVLALPAGSRNTAVPELDAAIGDLARMKGMRKVGRN